MSGNGGEAAAAFVDALRAASAALAEVPGKLEGARVHDAAFGKLFEAAEVRDAYHQRLPETEKDIAEAREVIEHFVTGLEGGHPIGPRRPEAELADVVVAMPAIAVIPEQPTAGERPVGGPADGPADNLNDHLNDHLNDSLTDSPTDSPADGTEAAS